MDPAGLRTLEEGARHLGDGGVRFAVICPSSHERARLPQLAGLHGVLNVHEWMGAAMEPWLDEAGETLAGHSPARLSVDGNRTPPLDLAIRS